MPRTVAAFVKDMIQRGKTDKQVRSVALSSRWEPQLEEALKLYKELSKGKKK